MRQTNPDREAENTCTFHKANHLKEERGENLENKRMQSGSLKKKYKTNYQGREKEGKLLKCL